MPPRKATKGAQAQAEPAMARTTRRTAAPTAQLGTPEASMPPPARGSPGGPKLKTPARRWAPTGGDYAASIESSHTNDTVHQTPAPTSSLARLAQDAVQASPRSARAVRDMSVVSENSTFSTRGLAKSMQASLPEMRRQSRKLYELLVSPGPKDEDWEIEVKQFRKRFDVERDVFLLPDHHSSIFIDPRAATAAAFQGPVNTHNELHRNMMQTLSVANLCVLLDGLADGSTLETLEGLESAFPHHFHPDSSGLDRDDIFERALDIRTQVFLARLQESRSLDSEDNIDPFQILADTFCEAAAAGFDSSAALERGLFKPFQGVNVSLQGNSPYLQRLRARVDDIQQKLQSDDLVVSMQELGLGYSFNDFSNGEQGLKYWIQMCYNAVAPWVLDQQPGVEALANFDGSELGSQSQEEIIRAGTQSHYMSDDGGQTAALFAKARAMGASGIDQQLFSTASAALAGQKRARAQQADDDNDDFQVDGRVPASQRQPMRGGQRKRARIAPKPAALAPGESPAGPSGQQIAPVPEMGLPPQDPDAIDIEALSHQAKAVSAARRKKPGPQIRTPWSKGDTQTLIRAIDAFECKWSAMEREINEGRLHFDHPRDQQALRDKSRLLKQDLLKTDRLLPRGFDNVVLGKKERSAVTGAGKNPFRKEADVDDQGNAINTEYDEAQDVVAQQQVQAQQEQQQLQEQLQEPQQEAQQEETQQEPQPEPQQEAEVQA